MKDYNQYTSRIPTPSPKRIGSIGSSPSKGNVLTTPTTPTRIPISSKSLSVQNNRNLANTATNGLYSTPSPAADKCEKESISSTGSQTSSTSPRQQPQQQYQKQPSSNPMMNTSTTTDVSIQRLKEQLEAARAKDNSTKAALAKSDAVILELRSNQRQIKRQLELLQQEKAEWNMNKKVSEIESTNKQNNQIDVLNRKIQELTNQLQVSESSSRDAKVGELQIQLDRAHAQILTADMVRKELEDTLEAEQYTWELRVQDQERQITLLQQECDTLAQDLNQCRSQWKEAECGWNDELDELREQLIRTQQQNQHLSRQMSGNSSNDNIENGEESSSSAAMVQKIHQLETERAELQSCLDEALKELEAVDAELQTSNNNDNNSANDGGNGSTRGRSINVVSNGGAQESSTTTMVESLQHLLRWVYQEGPGEKSQHKLSQNSQELVQHIQSALEDWLDATSDSKNGTTSRGIGGPDDQKVMATLKQQVSMYQEELKSREESSSELRESLKEAVALLKPLQDAVAQAEEEKAGLQQQLNDLHHDRDTSQEEIVQQSKKINSLQEQVTSLTEELEEQTRIANARQSIINAATPSPRKNRSVDVESTPGSEASLSKIQRAREELRRKRETEGNLQQLLKDAQSRFKNLHEVNENVAAKNRELQGKIEQLGVEDENSALANKLAQRELEIVSLRQQFRRLQQDMEDPASPNSSFHKAKTLEEELDRARSEMAKHEHTERALSKSLKEALGLLKPLQMHLEEAETEKMEISKELRNLRKRFRQLQMGEADDQSRSTLGGTDVSIELIKIKDELEETVRQLELENSQLHDALEDLTEDGGKHNDAKLRQRLVELNSRYEVTQNKLEDAHVENHALVKALKQKEMEEMNRRNELNQLRERLHKTETELNNAKSIAKSALVKVEELTMSNIEQLSITRDGPMDINLDGDSKFDGLSF
jgi:chromosome segregation ATPase